MKSSSERTIGYYDTHTEEWVASAHYRFTEEIGSFLGYVPFGSRVLEIGVGAGFEAENLARYYSYSGVEPSKGLLTVARKSNPGVDFRNILAQEVAENFAENSFDAFWTVATLLHVPKDEIKDTLLGIRTVVKNDGVGFITMKYGEGEIEDENGRTFSYYSLGEFTFLLEMNGFEVFEKEIEQTEDKTIWLKFFVRVRK
jgi:SAM-dependent methyltransferase